MAWLGGGLRSEPFRPGAASRIGCRQGPSPCKPIAATATTKIASHCTLPEPPCRPFAVENLAAAAFATRVGLSSASSRGMARPQAFAHPFLMPDDRTRGAHQDRRSRHVPATPLKGHAVGAVSTARGAGRRRFRRVITKRFARVEAASQNHI